MDHTSLFELCRRRCTSILDSSNVLKQSYLTTQLYGLVQTSLVCKHGSFTPPADSARFNSETCLIYSLIYSEPPWASLPTTPSLYHGGVVVYFYNKTLTAIPRVSDSERAVGSNPVRQLCQRDYNETVLQQCVMRSFRKLIYYGSWSCRAI